VTGRSINLSTCLRTLSWRNHNPHGGIEIPIFPGATRKSAPRTGNRTRLELDNCRDAFCIGFLRGRVFIQTKAYGARPVRHPRRVPTKIIPPQQDNGGLRTPFARGSTTRCPLQIFMFYFFNTFPIAINHGKTGYYERKDRCGFFFPHTQQV
jgi:hypothetical protein